MPGFADAGDLEEEDAVGVGGGGRGGEHVVDLLEEGGEVFHADVFGHFETGYFVVAGSGDGDVAVVHAEDAGLGFWDVGAAEAVVAPCCLVSSQGDSCDVRAVVGAGVFGESAPAAADVEKGFAGFEIDFFADDAEFVVLELFEGFFFVNVGYYAGGVDHAWA